MTVRAPKPYLVVRASIDPTVMAEFQAWYQETHLPNVTRIPGFIRAYRSNCHRPGTNWTALYEFRDDSAMQEAFLSAEATQARDDWQRWLPHVSELSVEVYAGLVPLPPYHHWN